MIYEILNGQTVIGRIECLDPAWMAAQYPTGNYRPAETLTPLEDEPQQPVEVLLTRSQFIDRVGDLKWAALRHAAVTDLVLYGKLERLGFIKPAATCTSEFVAYALAQNLLNEQDAANLLRDEYLEVEINP